MKFQAAGFHEIRSLHTQKLAVNKPSPVSHLAAAGRGRCPPLRLGASFGTLWSGALSISFSLVAITRGRALWGRPGIPWCDQGRGMPWWGSYCHTYIQPYSVSYIIHRHTASLWCHGTNLLGARLRFLGLTGHVSQIRRPRFLMLEVLNAR